MRLFTSKASKSSKPSNRSGRKAVRSASRVVSTRDSMFEPLEGREMFSVSAIHIVGPIIPIIPIFPTLTNAAITAEYVHTASETDAYGTKVQSLLGSATSDVEYVDSRSFLGDLGIALRSIPASLYGERASRAPDQIHLLGVPINNVTMDDAVHCMVQRLPALPQRRCVSSMPTA